MIQQHTSRGFLDLLFNCLLGFVFLFIISFLMVDVEKRKSSITTKAEFVITVTWEINDENDVDSWLRDPNGKIIYFTTKEQGFMHLDRDDRGNITDKFMTPDGTELSYPYNQEITTIRGVVPGQWVFNIHLYSKRDSEANVEVRMEKLNPEVRTIFIKHITLTKPGEEVTVARFEMDATGEILDTDEIYTSLVYERLFRSGDIIR